MGDSYRKDFKRRNDYSLGSKDYSKIRNSKVEKDRRPATVDKSQTRPTILIKAREADRAPSPGVVNSPTTSKKDGDTSGNYQIQSKPVPDVVAEPAAMIASKKLLAAMDMSSLQDNCLEFLSEQSDFLVVGCLGRQGTGKSTIMSLLAHPNADQQVFEQQTAEDVTNGFSVTYGINMYITSNRMILLDCQATLCPELPSYGDDNNAEMHGLQIAAFLFGVCHVVLFVHDYFIDPDLIRFLQTAEMLKPSTSTSIGETVVEYFPHLVFIHNRAEDWEFEPGHLQQIQDTYLKCFSHSRLQIQTGFGIANGDVSPVLNTTSCGPLVNVFLLPRFSSDDEVYTGHASFKDTFRHLRNQILSTPRTQISHLLLTEKNWFLYAGKVWEGIQKSSFFKEYHRLVGTI